MQLLEFLRAVKFLAIDCQMDSVTLDDVVEHSGLDRREATRCASAARRRGLITLSGVDIEPTSELYSVVADGISPPAPTRWLDEVDTGITDNGMPTSIECPVVPRGSRYSARRRDIEADIDDVRELRRRGIDLATYAGEEDW